MLYIYLKEKAGVKNPKAVRYVLKNGESDRKYTFSEVYNRYNQITSGEERPQNFIDFVSNEYKLKIDNVPGKVYNSIEEQEELNKNSNPLYSRNLKKEISEVTQAIGEGKYSEKSFIKHKGYFDNKINGLETSIGKKIYNPENRYFHIVAKHEEMLGRKRTEQIIETLQNPDTVNKTTSKKSVGAITFFREINNVKLMVVTRPEGDDLKIITAYIPKERNYIQGEPLK